MFRSRTLETVALAIVLGGCAGDGCLEEIPAGFPPGERMPNALQLRVSQAGLDSIENSVGPLAQALMPDGLSFAVPPSCGGNPEICCGLPLGACGVELDLQARPGDPSRLELAPAGAGAPVGMTLRARVRTAPGPLRVRYEVAFVSATCDVTLNTERSGASSVTVRTDLRFSQDPATQTTRVAFGGVSLDNLDTDDIDIGGGLICDLADFFKGFFVGTVRDQLEQQAGAAVEDLLCKSCETDAQCAPFGTCSGGTCQIADGSGARCMQELGVSGRLSAAALLPGFGDGASLDFYLVAGGSADGRQNGLSLGFSAGARAGNEGGPVCAPDAPAPALPAGGIPAMSVLDRNDLDGVGAFDFALGVHRSFLDRAAWGAYQSGLLCASLDTSTVELLNSDTLALLLPSMVDLLHGASRPVAIALRPQAPPVVELGGDTLLAMTLPRLEMDFSLLVDERFVRMFTARLDLRLPLDLEIDDAGAIVPVLGDVDGAFDGAEVLMTGLLEETPAEVANKLGVFGGLAVPMLADALGPIELPSLAGMTMSVPPGGIRAIDGGEFLGLFGDLELAPSARRVYVETRAELRHVRVPDAAAFASTRLDRAQRPAIALSLGGVGYDGTDRDLEWQVRLDGGTWSRYTRDRDLVVSRDELWLAGHHRVEVRARHVGQPASTDPTPVLLIATIDPSAPVIELQRRGERVIVDARDGVTPRTELLARYRFGDEAWRDAGPVPARLTIAGRDLARLEVSVVDEAGNAAFVSGAVLPVVAQTRAGGCAVGGERGGAGGVLLLALVTVALAFGRRRWRRGTLALALGALAACSGTVTGGGGDGTPDREDQKVVYGRWSDIAVSGDRVVVSAYEQLLGDLVVVSVAPDGNVTLQAVDGVPDEEPAGDLGDHRGGVLGAGPDVGAWTSVAIADGRALIAYQDRDAGALKLAIEEPDGWRARVVDRVDGVELGRYASLVVGADGRPAIAYMALGTSDGADGTLAELRWAQATTPNPEGPSDWVVEVIAWTPIVMPDSEVVDLPPGTGLFASAALLPDGRPVVAFYDREAGALRLGLRGGAAWTLHDLDADPAADAGRFASVAVDDAGLVHVAYQEVRSGSLRYVTFRDGAVQTREVIDDGVRGDGRHAVGASAALIMDDAGRPRVFYQDTHTVDLLSARRSDGGAWTNAEVMTGPVGYGFYVSAARAGSQIWLSNHTYDRAQYPPGTLAVTRPQ